MPVIELAVPFHPAGTTAGAEMTGMPRASRSGLLLSGATTWPLAGAMLLGAGVVVALLLHVVLVSVVLWVVVSVWAIAALPSSRAVVKAAAFSICRLLFEYATGGREQEVSPRPRVRCMN